jgi:hypothetical protein
VAQPPAAYRPIVRGRAGGLLAHIVASKSADHLPLYLRPRSMRRCYLDLVGLGWGHHGGIGPAE